MVKVLRQDICREPSETGGSSVRIFLLYALGFVLFFLFVILFTVHGNAAALLLFAAPTLTMSRIVRKKSTEGFSCVPYITTLFNCLLYTWYGLPVIKVTATVIPAILVFCITAFISAVVFHDHQHRKVFVGSVAIVASVSMYASPLVVVKQVILTKSVEYMPFYVSLFSFISSSLWMAYGLLSHDIFVASPNLVGTPLSILQLVLYCKYRKGGTVELPNKRDPEGNKVNDEKTIQLQIVICDTENGKN
ncbi:bidirectional sugar transporter SWEET3-like [Pyrus ussuriensis x Pyrus communis]|uniref:Bidirectional sugar transporter SWEET n=1 Tax=Pyrus ussuriensis x Pyrus communis TaxID=2448454 RepID=A0A5N5F6R9_9ROSA|nr:bidirectional sugar transporter SWEET3-like [Pyrus ussuriensis x Pyrus communis]